MKKILLLLFAALMGVVNVANAETRGADITLWDEVIDLDSEGATENGTNTYFLSDAGVELVEAGAIPGDVIRFYATKSNDNWYVNVQEGHWGTKYIDGLNGGVIDLSTQNYFELELTQTILDEVTKKQWWGGTFVLQGKYITISKVILIQSGVLSPTKELKISEIATAWGEATAEPETGKIAINEKNAAAGWSSASVNTTQYPYLVVELNDVVVNGDYLQIGFSNDDNATLSEGNYIKVIDLSSVSSFSRVVFQGDAGCSLTIKQAYFATADYITENGIEDYSYVPVTFPAGKTYVSFASDNALDFSEVDGLEAYIVSSLTSTEATMKKVNEAPAQTGLILKGTAGTVYQVPIVPSAASVGTNKLWATIAETSISTKPVYVLSDGQFKLFTGSVIPAWKAYLLAEDIPTEAHELSLNFGDATGIKNIKVGTEDNVYYDLQGRRVLYPTKGLYIVNGKKVIVK